MRAGELRHRVTFQARVLTPDSTGQEIASWVDSFTCWAQVSPKTGRELLAAQQIQSVGTHTIEVRYRPELADPLKIEAMRIVYGTRTFNITASQNDDERNRMVTIDAQEGLIVGDANG